MNIVDRYNKTGPYEEEQRNIAQEKLRKIDEDHRQIIAMMIKQTKSLIMLAYFGLAVIVMVFIGMIYTKTFKASSIAMIYPMILIPISIKILKRTLKRYTKEM